MAKLRRLNRIATNTITSVRKSNPSRALEIIYDIQPLHLEILKVDLCSYIRLENTLTNLIIYTAQNHTIQTALFQNGRIFQLKQVYAQLTQTSLMNHIGPNY